MCARKGRAAVARTTLPESSRAPVDPFPGFFPPVEVIDKCIGAVASTSNARKLIRDVQERWTLPRAGLSTRGIPYLSVGLISGNPFCAVLSGSSRRAPSPSGETWEGSERRHRNFLTVLDKSRRFLDLRRSLSSATPLPRSHSLSLYLSISSSLSSLSSLQVYFVIVSFPFDSSRDHRKLGPPGIVSASLVKGTALSIATEIQ